MRSDAEQLLIDKFDAEYLSFNRAGSQRLRRVQALDERALLSDVIDAERRILMAKHRAKLCRLQASEIDPASPHADERIAALEAKAAASDAVAGTAAPVERPDAKPSEAARPTAAASEKPGDEDQAAPSEGRE